jgi:hypothetical protein
MLLLLAAAPPLAYPPHKNTENVPELLPPAPEVPRPPLLLLLFAASPGDVTPRPSTPEA